MSAGLRLLQQQAKEENLKLKELRRLAAESFAAIDIGEFETVNAENLSAATASCKAPRGYSSAGMDISSQPARKTCNHLFLYRIVGEQTVDVARLLHESMDLRINLPQDFGEQMSVKCQI